MIILLILAGIVGRALDALFPAAPPPATVAFGKLPRMDLSQGIEAQGKTFILQTVSGDFPQLAGQAKVFAVGEPEPSFGQLDEIKKRLTSIGFDQQGVEIEPGILRFRSADEGNRTMTVELKTGNFTLDAEIAGRAEILNSRPNSIEDAKNRALAFINTTSGELVDFPKEELEAKFLRVDGTKLTQTDALSSANLVQVNFRRGDLDLLPVIWPREDEPMFYVTVSANEVVYAKMDILAIQKFKFATYPLKGPERAFEDLKAGRAAFMRPVTTSEVTILDVDLGYVESTKNREYLQPVYIFRATDNLLAYVPAVDDLWIE